MAKIIIPTPLRRFTDNQSSVETESATVIDAVKALSTRFPELAEHLFDERGNLRKFIRVYVGDKDIRELDNEQSAVSRDSVVSIIPAIAGGVTA